MKAIVQRVSSCEVSVRYSLISKISKGILAYVGFARSDTEKDIEFVAKKILSLRVFKGTNERLEQSVQDVGGDIMIVSQFTLYGDASRGTIPSFSAAASYRVAEPLYRAFIDLFNKVDNLRVETGEFGQDMSVMSINDGPVNLIIDSAR